MRQPIRLFAPLDTVVIALLAAALVLCFPLFHAIKPASAVVFRDNRKIAVYPLDQDRVFTVNGHEGPVTVSIRGKKVRILSSNCPKKICMHTAAAGDEIRQIVCVPNHIIIELQTQKDCDLDAVTQ